MNVILKNRISVFVSVLAIVAASRPASAEDLWPELGLQGLRRVELAFVNGDQGDPAAPQADASKLPADDLVGGDLAKHHECKAIGVSLGRAGLEVVPQCKPDDAACAKLSLTVENQSKERTADRIYLISVELAQPMMLVREKDKKSTPLMATTWSKQGVAVVSSDASATNAACVELRGFATFFGSQWRMSNK